MFGANLVAHPLSSVQEDIAQLTYCNQILFRNTVLTSNLVTTAIREASKLIPSTSRHHAIVKSLAHYHMQGPNKFYGSVLLVRNMI